MNCISPNVNSSLVVVKTHEYTEDLYRMCLQRVKNGSICLILTSKSYSFSHILAELEVSREELKRFIVIKFTKISHISKKIMSLHDWSLLPSVVVVDVTDLLTFEMTSLHSLPHSTIMQSLALCAASFLNYLNSISKQKQIQFNIGKINGGKAKVQGFLIASVRDNKLEDHLQLLKELYFNKNPIVENLKQLREKLKDGED